MGGVVDFVGDVVGGAADVVGDVVGGAADFVGDVAETAVDIVYETPFVADVISVAFPPAAPFIQAGKVAYNVSEGNLLGAALGAAGMMNVGAGAEQFQVWNDDLGEFVNVSDMPANWSFGTPGNVADIVDTTTGALTQVPWSQVAQGGSSAVSNIQQAFAAPTGQAASSGLSNWLAENVGGTSGFWGGLGSIGSQAAGLYYSKEAAKELADAQRQAAQLSYEAGMPWSVTGPGATLAVNQAGRTISTSLAPELQQLYSQSAAQAGQMAGMLSGYYPQSAGIAQRYLGQVGQGLSATEGLAGIQRGLLESELGRYGEAMGATAGYTPMQAGIAADLLGRAGTQAQAITAYDPATAASQYYQQYVEPDLLRQQQREQLGLESRLLSQGMLGSTGGALRQEALATAQSAEQRAARGAALTQAQANLDLMRQRQMADIQAGAGLMTDIYGRGTGALAAGTGLGTTILGQTGTQLAAGRGLYGDISSGMGTQLGYATDLLNVPVQYGNIAIGAPGNLVSGARTASELQAGAAANLSDAYSGMYRGLFGSLGSLFA